MHHAAGGEGGPGWRRQVVRKGTVTPERLKQMVGDRLKEHGKYKQLLDAEGKRCWTLEYAETDGVGFHLDVLPACPEDDTSRMHLVIAGIPEQYAENAIAVNRWVRYEHDRVARLDDIGTVSHEYS